MSNQMLFMPCCCPASLMYVVCVCVCSQLPLILTLVSLSAAIGLTRLPVLSYVQDGPGKEALLSNGTDTAENVIQFSIFAAYGCVLGLGHTRSQPQSRVFVFCFLAVFCRFFSFLFFFFFLLLV